MAKKKKIVAPAKPTTMTKKQLSRWEREQRQVRNLWIFTIGIMGLAVLALVFGFVREFVLLPGEPVLKVGDRTISQAMYARIVGLRDRELQRQILYAESQAASYSQAAQTDPSQSFLAQWMTQQVESLKQQRGMLDIEMLEALVDEEVIRQEAIRRGIVVSAADVEASLISAFSPQSSATEPLTSTETLTETTPTPTVSPDAWRAVYQRYLTEIGVSDAEYRQIAIEPALYRQRLQEVMAAEVPTATEQLHLYAMITDTVEAANGLLTLLQGGATFADLSAAPSELTATVPAWDMGWFPQVALQNEYGVSVADRLWTMAPGQLVTEPLQISYGFLVAQVVERNLNQPLTDSTRQQLQQAAFDEWLRAARTKPDVQRFLDSNKVTWVRKQVEAEAKKLQTAAQR